jgi:hypothetical protein
MNTSRTKHNIIHVCVQKYTPTRWNLYLGYQEDIQECNTYNPIITMHKDDGGFNRS